MTGGDRQSQLTVADTFWFKYTLSALAAVVAESGIMLVFLNFDVKKIIFVRSPRTINTHVVHVSRA